MAGVGELLLPLVVARCNIGMQAHFQLPKSAMATLTEISVMIHGLFGHFPWQMSAPENRPSERVVTFTFARGMILAKHHRALLAA